MGCSAFKSNPSIQKSTAIEILNEEDAKNKAPGILVTKFTISGETHKLYFRELCPEVSSTRSIIP